MAPPRFSPTLCLALVAGILFAADAQADQVPAGSVAVGRACYVNTARALAQITVTGSGWEAGSTIELTDKLDRISATATASTSGTFAATVPAPVVDQYKGPQISDTITAAYESDPGLPSDTGASTSSSPFETTNYSVMQDGNRTDPNAKSVFELSGFTPGRTVFAHYLTRSGTWLANVSFGKPTGACGLLRVKAFASPGVHHRKGTYTVQFDNFAKYRKPTEPQYRLIVSS